MAVMEFMVGMSIALFFLLFILVLILSFQTMGSAKKPRPVREDLQKIKAQIEDREYVA